MISCLTGRPTRMKRMICARFKPAYALLSEPKFQRWKAVNRRQFEHWKFLITAFSIQVHTETMVQSGIFLKKMPTSTNSQH